MSMDIRKIKKLIEMLQESDLTEIEVTEGEEAVRISRKSSNDIVVEKPTSDRKVETIINTETKETSISGSKTITSPIVGTFYRRPAPDKDPYVKVGDVIDAGQIVCIVEAMKMMNEIKSEFSGKIVAIEVEDGEPVQFFSRFNHPRINVKKVLIANRGEISLRAIRACKELGLKTVCIYSEGDKELKSLRFSDESVCVGPADPTKSYLDAPAILSAADVTGSDAIYPGYGFLAEDHSFAEQCNLSGFKFIGPSSQTIRQMGDKITAKSIVTKYGIDGVPGYDKELPNNEEEILKIADEIGYPLIVKATAGGGGRGMKCEELKGAN